MAIAMLVCARFDLIVNEMIHRK